MSHCRNTSSSDEKINNMTADNKHSHDVEVLFAQAHRDLDNADFHHHGAFVLDPLRTHFVRPFLDFCYQVLLPLANSVPWLGAIIVWCCDIILKVFRYLYFMTHDREDCQTEFQEFLKSSDIVFQVSEKSQNLGVLWNYSRDFLSDPSTKIRQWREYNEAFESYGKTIGFQETALDPMLKDPFDENKIILGSVQAVADNTLIRRNKTAFSTDNNIPEHSSEQDQQKQLDVFKIAKLMRYCCAAYGKSMMDAADIAGLKDHKEIFANNARYFAMLSEEEALKQQVCDHVGIPAGYITHFNLGYGGDMENLRYFISADHEMESVILVLRGTGSLTQWQIDFQGQSKDFCGGQAHSGIADSSHAVAKSTRTEVASVLETYPGYKLVITGQSLGGGLAPLVNMLFHHDPLFENQHIECHAFAGPPVYESSNPPAYVTDAIKDCTSYIHGDDIAPYMGIHGGRRLGAKLLAINKAKQDMGLIDRILTVKGRKPFTPEMANCALNGDAHIEPVPGGPVLKIAAKEIVWFVKDPNQYKPSQDNITYMICDPNEFSKLAPLASPDGGKHHVPQTYETVLNHAVQHGWTKLEPPKTR